MLVIVFLNNFNFSLFLPVGLDIAGRGGIDTRVLFRIVLHEGAGKFSLFGGARGSPF